MELHNFVWQRREYSSVVEQWPIKPFVVGSIPSIPALYGHKRDI